MWQKAGEEKEFVDCYSKIVNSRVQARLVAVKEALIQVASLGLHEFIALVERKQSSTKVFQGKCHPMAMCSASGGHTTNEAGKTSFRLFFINSYLRAL